MLQQYFLIRWLQAANIHHICWDGFQLVPLAAATGCYITTVDGCVSVFSKDKLIDLHVIYTMIYNMQERVWYLVEVLSVKEAASLFFSAVDVLKSERL